MFFFAKGEARHAFFYDEGSDTFHTFALVGHGKYDIGFGFTTVGDKDFAAGYVIMVAAEHCYRLLGSGVGACVGLGQGEAAHFAAFNQGHEVFLFLFFGAVGEERPGSQGYCCRKADIEAAVALADLFQHGDVADVVPAGAAVLFRETDAGETHVHHLVVQFPGEFFFLVPFGSPWRQLLLSEFLRHLLHHFLFFSKLKIHLYCLP